VLVNNPKELLRVRQYINMKMSRNTLLLQENPPYVLAPGIDLPQNVIVNAEKIYSKEGSLKCDGCGKALTTPYYVSFGIPPCSLIIETYRILADSDVEFKQLAYETQSHGILSREDLIRLTSENDEEFKRLVSEIQSVAKRFDIDSKYQWIFSEQNIKNSKTRICSDCQKECKWRLWRGFEIPTIHIQEVCFAVEEYQRRHTPIATAKSDYERYIISLPNRTNIAQQHFGDVDLNEDFWIVDHEERMIDCLSTAKSILFHNTLFPSYLNLIVSNIEHVALQPCQRAYLIQLRLQLTVCLVEIVQKHANLLISGVCWLVYLRQRIR
jgi:hypothetical protein